MAFTYFFRDMHTLGLVEEHAIPWLKSRRYIDIWDAGCASGPEPYTLAILLRENMGDFLFKNVRIFATDLNPDFEPIIGQGVYASELVKRIPSEILEKHFTNLDGGDDYQLSEAIRRSVKFQYHNLTTLNAIRAGFGLVVCKNVLLHISEQERVGVLKMFYDALDPEGFLAIEPTQKMPAESEKYFSPIASSGGLYRRVS